MLASSKVIAMFGAAEQNNIARCKVESGKVPGLSGEVRRLENCHHASALGNPFGRRGVDLEIFSALAIV